MGFKTAPIPTAPDGPLSGYVPGATVKAMMRSWRIWHAEREPEHFRRGFTAAVKAAVRVELAEQRITVSDRKEVAAWLMSRGVI